MSCPYFEEVIKYHECGFCLEKTEVIEQHLESCKECRELLSILSFSKDFISKEPVVDMDFYSKVSSKIDSSRYKKKKINFKILKMIQRLKHSCKPAAVFAAVLVMVVFLGKQGMPYFGNSDKNNGNPDLQISRLHNGGSSWDMVNRMGKGINLGNTLESPYEGEWGMPAQEYYFDDFIKAGFNNVRIPVRWDKHMETEYPYTIDSAWFNRVEQVLEWSLSRGFVTILNSHHDDWIKDDYRKNIQRFEMLWEQVAQRFKDKSENLVFEICNEPFGNIASDEINDMNKRILAKIRVHNPTRCVIIGGGNWYNYKTLLKDVDIPEDPHIIATFHYYEPYNFTQQSQGTWGSDGDKLVMKAAFDEIKDWSYKKNTPVLLGEFGVMAHADNESRVKYYDYVTDEALKRGFAFSVWDNGTSSSGLNDMAFYNRSTRKFDPSILNAIINTPVAP